MVPRGSSAKPTPGILLAQEILEQRMPVLSQDRLRVELNTLDWHLAVSESHDFAVFGPRGDLEVAGQGLPLDRERVVAGCRERRRQPPEDALPRVMDRRGFAVHQRLRVNDLAAERL